MNTNTNSKSQISQDLHADRKLQTSSEIAITIADAIERVLEGVALANSRGIKCDPPTFLDFTTEISTWGDVARFTVYLNPYTKLPVEENEFLLEHTLNLPNIV